MPMDAARGLHFEELPIFERSAKGRSGLSLGSAGVPDVDPALVFGALSRKVPAELPEVSPEDLL